MVGRSARPESVTWAAVTGNRGKRSRRIMIGPRRRHSRATSLHLAFGAASRHDLSRTPPGDKPDGVSGYGAQDMELSW
jgi:hypothetical protein